MIMRCVTGKRCFESEELAVEALVQHHIINHYSEGQGPINVYHCPHCEHWHFTSKGERNEILNDPGTQARIKKERQSNYWERKLR